MTDLLQSQLDDTDRTAAALDEIAAGAGRRDEAHVPPFPEDAIAALQTAGLMSWGAMPGPARPPGCAGARPHPQRGAGRRLGGSDLRRTCERDRAARRPGNRRVA